MDHNGSQVFLAPLQPNKIHHYAELIKVLKEHYQIFAAT